MFLRKKGFYYYLIHAYRQGLKIRHYQIYLGKITGMDYDQYQKLRDKIRRFFSKHAKSVSSSPQVILLQTDALFYGAKLTSPPKKWWLMRKIKWGYVPKSWKIDTWLYGAKFKVSEAKWEYETKILPKDRLALLRKKRLWNSIISQWRKWGEGFDRPDINWKEKTYSELEEYSQEVFMRYMGKNNPLKYWESFDPDKRIEAAKLLGVDEPITKEKIIKQFRNLAMKHHPDHGGDGEEFKKVRSAYEILLN